MKQKLQGEAAWIYRKVLSHPLLAAFLKQQEAGGKPIHIGWGYRPSGRAAKRKGGRLLLLEDAFVRSLRPGHGGAVYGLIADSRGIHYAADGESDLLHALESGKPCGWMNLGNVGDPALLMARFRETAASKYNWFPGEYRDERVPDELGILVVDQSRGDAAIRHGGLAVADFGRMLRVAMDECQGAPAQERVTVGRLGDGSNRACVLDTIAARQFAQLLALHEGRPVPSRDLHAGDSVAEAQALAEAMDDSEPVLPTALIEAAPPKATAVVPTTVVPPAVVPAASEPSH